MPRYLVFKKGELENVQNSVTRKNHGRTSENKDIFNWNR